MLEHTASDQNLHCLFLRFNYYFKWQKRMLKKVIHILFIYFSVTVDLLLTSHKVCQGKSYQVKWSINTSNPITIYLYGKNQYSECVSVNTGVFNCFGVFYEPVSFLKLLEIGMNSLDLLHPLLKGGTKKPKSTVFTQIYLYLVHLKSYKLFLLLI